MVTVCTMRRLWSRRQRSVRPPHITTLSHLREHAARRNVDINLPPPQADAAPQAALTDLATP